MIVFGAERAAGSRGMGFVLFFFVFCPGPGPPQRARIWSKLAGTIVDWQPTVNKLLIT